MGEAPQEIPADEDSAAEGETPVVEPVADQNVYDGRLEQLAQQRAEAVSTYLIDKANVEAKRIQLKPFQIKPAPNGDSGFVELSLSVE